MLIVFPVVGALVGDWAAGKFGGSNARANLDELPAAGIGVAVGLVVSVGLIVANYGWTGWW